MSDTIRLDRSNNQVRRKGYETGKLSIAQETIETLVVHEAGHSFWCSHSTYDYASSEYHVFKINHKNVSDNEIEWECERIVDFPVRLIKGDYTNKDMGEYPAR